MERFDAAAHLVRARRRAGLSQREMADAVGVAQSTLAGYESGSRGVSLTVLVRVLSRAGLRLSVVDAQGAAVRPFPATAVRDNAGRRFPAHLEVQPPDRLPREALRAPRYDRRPPKAWYHLRGSDEVQAAARDAQDHPTDLELALRLRDLRTAGARRLRAQRAALGGAVDGD